MALSTSATAYPDRPVRSSSLISTATNTDRDRLGSSSGSLSSSRPGANRPPTLSFPTLHLGSFDTLTVDSFPSPPPSGITSDASTLTSPDQPGGLSEGWRAPSGEGGLRPLPSVSRRESGDSDGVPNLSVPARSRESSRGSIRSRGHIPPALPPPTISLPPLPLLSPISPLSSFSPTRSNLGSASLSPARSSSMNDQASSEPGSRGGPADLGQPIGPSRPVGAPLTINIPSALPFLDADRAGSGSSAVLKTSPGMARRRTLVNGDREDRDGRLSGIVGAVETSSREQGSPEPKRRQEASQTQSSGSKTSPSSTHRLEKKSSTKNLQESPRTSPTAKRSLPRPPLSDIPSYDTNNNPGPSYTPQAPQRIPSYTPRTASHPPPVQTPLAAVQQQVQSSQQLQPPQHRPTNSASALPIIAGLADAGPYPSSRPTSIKNQQGTLGRGSGPRPPPQEEICLECMMRDRDLADVTVLGEGAWERASNEAWEDAKRREEELLRSFGSVENGMESEEGCASASPPSTAYSAEENEQQRQQAAAKERREAKRARRVETDRRVNQEVGWRGFKWEEGSSGDGLPKSFRGTKGGKLTEDGIKAVMTKFPSASAHRYNWLQSYLRHQYMLTVDIAAEAKRLGYFPVPVEVVYSPSTSHEAFMPSLKATGSRTSSLAWDNSQPLPRSSVDQQYRSPTYVSSPAAMSPSLVRPSPSSPADLAMAGRPPRIVPIARPTTQFIPDREPNPASARQKLGIGASNYSTTSLMLSPGIAGRDRYGNSPDMDDEQWPPISPGESGIRPFSFAVRAGAVAADRGSDGGHGRRSIFGRWGGSVTSFFGGSQGGSGSMMDMHLGLDSDRRNQASSQYMHSQPRAVSAASPQRPAFFGNSRSSSYDNRMTTVDRTGRSMSNSRLSQVLRDENEPAQSSPTPKKEKGLKGLLNKMKPKSRKSVNGRENTPSTTTSSPYRPQQQLQAQQYRQGDQSSQLQPPPSISYLVGRGDGRHRREGSGSSSSMLTDPNEIGRPSSAALPGAMRSVSAPFAGSSSGGSQNVSPTSSRFDKYGNANGVPTGPGVVNGRRGSYTSLSNRPGSGYEAELARESIVEVLSGQGQREMGSTPRRGSEDRYERPGSSGQTYSSGPQQGTYRPHNKTTSLLSASSVVETPPPIQNPGAYFGAQQHLRSGHSKQPSDQLSPNRFKNLPPLPPPGNEVSDSSYAPQQYQSQHQSPYPTPRHYRSTAADGSAPRASFEPSPGREREREYQQPSPRLAHSMYAQPTGMASVNSLGSFAKGFRGGQPQHADAYGGMQQADGSVGGGYDPRGFDPYGYPRQGWGGDGENVVDLSATGSSGKGTTGRKGLKGLFGKAGRLA